MGDLKVMSSTELLDVMHGRGEGAMTAWHDANPYVLIIIRDVDEAVIIDLGEFEWMKKYSPWLRGKSRWFLARKSTWTPKGPDMPIMPVLWLNVEDGDQPYYTARHTGVAGRMASSEVVSYGIGAKRADGHVDRIWVLPNGLICSGEDVDTLAMHLIKAGAT